MAINSLSLPVDIPWKRLCVSQDMIDPEVCDRKFPYRWRSSVALFSYEPPEEYQTYEGMLVSYLKVACTITGFQADPTEVGITDRRVDSAWNDPLIIEQFNETVTPYYGCHGAVLEIAVAPKNRKNVPLEEYPYFADFEPKKRELYEIVSETGEKLSRTLEDVSIGKGATTTITHELLDVIGGEGWSVEAQGGGGGGAVAHDVSGQWGTKDMTQRQYSDVRTTDRARETREGFSHTTQLTQMYHQLLSYHLGTNRAVFFMLPRPHIVESEHTFVNGPRLLEGIQEFFLIVLRPKEIRELCVEAYLETAHISSWPVAHHRQTSEVYTFRIDTSVLGDVPDRSPMNPETGNHTQWQWASATEIYPPGGCPDGWEVDLDRCGGYLLGTPSSRQSPDNYHYSVTSATRDGIEIHGSLRREYNTWGIDSNDWTNNHILEVPVTVYLRAREPEIVAYQNTLFMTGRGVCCCPEVQGLALGHDSVVAEVDLRGVSAAEALGKSQMSIKTANLLNAEIGRQLLKYFNHPDRYPFGTISFLDTQFVGRRLAMLMPLEGHPDNHAIQDIKGVDPKVAKSVCEIDPKVTRRWLLKTPLAEIRDRFGLSHEETVQLRRSSLGLEGPPPDPKDRWDPPGMRKRSEQVPDIIGLSLESAKKALEAIPFFLGAVSYRDNVKPRGTILKQHPRSGTNARPHTGVDVQVSSGLVVQIPDIVGMPLSQAIVALLEAGLESEPEIVLTPSAEKPKGHVLEVKPGMRSFVTPHASVVLNVAKESPVQLGAEKQEMFHG